MMSCSMIVATILVLQADAAPRRYVIESKEGGFSASFPTLPRQGTQKGRNAKGETEVLYLQADHEGLIYRIERGEVAEPIASREDEDNYFKGFRVFIAGQSVIKEEKRVELLGYPGREWVLERSFKAKTAPSTFVFRTYLVNDKLYQVRLFATKPGEAPPEAARKAFFDSFKLIGVKPRPAEPAADAPKNAPADAPKSK